MTCDWCDKLKPVTVIEREPETVGLCDDCKNKWSDEPNYSDPEETALRLGNRGFFSKLLGLR